MNDREDTDRLPYESLAKRGGPLVKAKQSPLQKEEDGDESEHIPTANERDYPSLLRDLRKELELEEAKSQEYLKRLQYLQADYENYRKRVDREIGEAKRYGNERLLADLLIVVDELELAVDRAKRQSVGNEGIVEGVSMVLKRLQSILAKEGVAKIEALRARFNPDLHEAALRVPAKGKEEDGMIVEEIRSGYTIKGRVLRPSIVKVAESMETSQDNLEMKDEIGK